MKYIITWVLIETLFAPSTNLALVTRMSITPQSFETKTRKDALDFYKNKVIEDSSQYSYLNGRKIILCPKCYSYISEVKLDSIKAND